MVKKKATKARGGTITVTAAEVQQIKKALAIIRRVKAQQTTSRKAPQMRLLAR